MERLLLLGYFGAGNFGDDALLTAWLVRHRDWLDHNHLAVDICVSGGLPPFDGFLESRDLAGIECKLIPRQQLSALRADNYRGLIVPGGSLLQDETSLRSLLFYLLVIRRFLSIGKPVYLLNQGIGPIRSWLGRWLTPRYLQNVRMLSFRDRDSYDWAKDNSLLSNHPNLFLACDPILESPLQVIPPGELETDLPSDYVLFIPRRTGDLPYPLDETPEHEAMAVLIRHVVAETGLNPCLLPVHGAQDAEFCNDISSAAGGVPVLDPGPTNEHRNTEIMSIIAGARLVVSHRLHGLICAVAHGIPVLGVAYDPKVVSFCNEIAYPYSYPANLHQEETLMDIVRLWKDREEAREIAASNRQGMLSRLATARDRFLELLETPDA